MFENVVYLINGSCKVLKSALNKFSDHPVQTFLSPYWKHKKSSRNRIILY